MDHTKDTTARTNPSQKQILTRTMSTEDKKKLTAEDLVDLSIPNNVRLSPSGKQVIYTVAPASKKDKHEVSAIWIADVGKKFSARQLTSGLFNDTQPQWSPDGQTIAFISDRGEAGDTSALYLLSVYGGEAYPITPAKNKNGIARFLWSPNGKCIAFTSADELSEERKRKEEDRDDVVVYGEHWDFNRLRLVQVVTREVSVLFKGDAHVNDISWNADSSEIAFITQALPGLNASADGASFVTVSLLTGKSSPVCDFPGVAGELLWHKKDLFFVGGARPSKSNTSRTVYKIRLGGEELTWTRYAYGEENDVIRFRVAGDTVYVQIMSGLIDQIHKLSTQKTIYDNQHTLESWDIMLRDDGGDEDVLLVFTRSTIGEPSQVYSYTEGSPCPLSQHNRALADPELSPQAFYAEAEDGTKLDGIFTVPSPHNSSSHDRSKPWPTFVNVHGGPYSRAVDAFGSSAYNWAPWLLSAGYAVLSPNYRGGMGHGDGFASAAAGGMGALDYDDVVTLVKAGIERGVVDAQRVVIGGWSQGGFLAYLASTRASRFPFRAAVCGAGVTDWDLMSLTSDIPSFEAELAGKAPWEKGACDTQDRRGSPIWHLADGEEQRRIPVLILHGKEDVRVPVTQALAFHRGCLRWGVPVEMAIYPREGHHIKERLHRLDVLKRLRRFVDLHLG
ncbi:Alpha/Beta hydrolase protein [Bisporella sp. PMI_857]|nr:Alpha/Beta hydrolase protein [Bisporella sp. PMI_857]